jgi:hypothetical protein
MHCVLPHADAVCLYAEGKHARALSKPASPVVIVWGVSAVSSSCCCCRVIRLAPLSQPPVYCRKSHVACDCDALAEMLLLVGGREPNRERCMYRAYLSDIDFAARVIC